MAQTRGTFPELSDNVRRTMAKQLSPKKARKILKHGEVRGKPVTEKQRGLFGLIAGGSTPTRLKERSTHDRRRRSRERARG